MARNPAIEAALRTAGEVNKTRPELARQNGNAATLGQPTPDVTHMGKQPHEWTPQDFKEFGEHHGAANFGPESAAKWKKELQPLQTNSGRQITVPGGVDNPKPFSYYDMLHMKSQGVDPNDLPPETHQKIHSRMIAAMQPGPEGHTDTQIGNQMLFGMISPNQPLTANELALQRIMLKNPADLDKLASMVPYHYTETIPSIGERQEHSRRISKALGLHAGEHGGIGASGSANYSDMAEFAQKMKDRPDFFRFDPTNIPGTTPSEKWAGHVTRIFNEIRGLKAKTGSLATVWQDPQNAAISAIDRHMATLLRHNVFLDADDQHRWEQGVLGKFNHDRPSEKAKSIDEMLTKPGGRGHFVDNMLQYVNNLPTAVMRDAKTGGYSRRVPESLRNVKWVGKEPAKAELIGKPYIRALEANEEHARAAGQGLFSNQWMLWDRIRKRLEPHEILHPDLQKLPRMSLEQMRRVAQEHADAGYMAATGTVRPMPSAGHAAYFAAGGPVVDQAMALRLTRAEGGALAPRQLNPQGLYSHAAEVAQNLPQQRGSMQQMGAMLQKQGVKPAEMQNADPRAAFGARQVTRDQLAQHFQQAMPKLRETLLDDSNEGASEDESDARTKYGDYAVPGGDNYRELLMHLPEAKAPRSSPETDKLLRAQNDTHRAAAQHHMKPVLDPAAHHAEQRRLEGEAELAQRAYHESVMELGRKAKAQNYQSSHWDEPNVVAHLRMSDRRDPTDPEGGKLLHLEELQSDWGQQGRERGFRGERENNIARLMAARDAAPDGPLRMAAQEKVNAEADKAHDVTAGPYVGSTNGWTDLGLKRALLEAAKGDYSRLAWTPGQEQADRYGLHKKFSKITYVPPQEGQGRGVFSAHQIGRGSIDQHVPPEQLPDMIGKELAQRLLAAPHGPIHQFPDAPQGHVLTGDDLVTGGEGMRGFYDKLVPTRLKEIVKRLGHEAQFEPVTVKHRSKVAPGSGKTIKPSDFSTTLHSLKMTPELKESILGGMPAFKRGGDVEPDHTGYADGGAVAPDMPEPQRKVRAYKLFRHKDGKLYPLFVNAHQEVPVGKWLRAEAGPEGKKEGKVKSKLGDLAYRPGWHSGDLPIATHIGGNSTGTPGGAPDYRPDEHVWAEVEHPADVDWQSVADSRARITKAGTPDLKTAHVTDQVPHGGFYRYKTNPNMTGNWLISGGMKVKRVLSDKEVKAINARAGVADLPRRHELQPDLVEQALRVTAKPAKTYAAVGNVGKENPYVKHQDGPFLRIARRSIAQEANRKSPLGNFNPGTVDQPQAQNDLERMTREHGYSGVANPHAAYPMAAMWNKVPVQPAAQSAGQDDIVQKALRATAPGQ